MLQYIFAGLALGSIYAIASSSLTITYVSAGILNFAFGSMAYFIARAYYYLNTQHNMSTPVATILSLLVIAPALGAVLWAVLFRFLRQRSSLIKIVASVGLSVALPPIADMIFGQVEIQQAPGFIHEPVPVYHPFGAAVGLDQIVMYACVAGVVIIGTVVLRFSRAGLRVRAMVDSEALTSLSGTSPAKVSLAVWASTTALAGLAGILVAPTNGLSTSGMTTLMVAAFASVIAAKLRSLPGAVIVALLMGVVTEVVQKYLPPQSTWTAAIVPSIPFAFILLFLLYHILTTGSVVEDAGTGGALDRAIAPQSGDRASAAAVGRGSASKLAQRVRRTYVPLLVLAVAALLPVILQGFWLTLTAQGMALAIIFLSFTLVTGEGGMIWLCQITFAGAGAIAAAQLNSIYNWPPLLSVLVAGLIIVPFGLIVGFLTIRLGNLYVALVTLSFGLLIETLVFTINRFNQQGVGVPINRPSFASSDQQFAYLALVVFLIFAILVANLRRSTAGMALGAVRWSETGARTIGVSVIQMKLLATGLSTYIAAVGGGFYAMDNLVAQTSSYDTFVGLTWLAVVVTLGVRSIASAAVAGLVFAIFPGWFLNELPTNSNWGSLPTLLFGLGAIGVALNPDGSAAVIGQQIETLVNKLVSRRRPAATLAPALVTAGGPTEEPPPHGSTVPAGLPTTGGDIRLGPEEGTER